MATAGPTAAGRAASRAAARMVASKATVAGAVGMAAMAVAMVRRAVATAPADWGAVAGGGMARVAGAMVVARVAVEGLLVAQEAREVEILIRTYR